MESMKRGGLWRGGYALCCLVYATWMVFLSLDNFGMVHDDYRRAGESLRPPMVKEIALRELADQCRRETSQRPSGRGPSTTDQTCLSPAPEVLAARQRAVAERLVAEKRGALSKLLLCYAVFGVVFLFLPPLFLYLLLAFLIWLFKSTTVGE